MAQGRRASRSSSHAAAVADFPDGVRFVELAPVADPQLVPQTVAAALGVREQPDRTAVEALIDHLGTRRVLVILDNCEHLIEACSEVVTGLLSACSQLTILATSRAALRAAGELLWRIPLLDVPDESTDVEQVAASDAVRLFVERAVSSSPGSS